MGRSGLLAALMLLPASWTTAAALDGPSPGADWKPANKDKDLIAFVRDDPATKAREVRAYTEMSAPPWAIFNVVTDYDNYPKFMPFTKEERVLGRPQPTQVVTYSLITPPATAWRDSVVHINLTLGTKDNGGVFRSEWSAHPGEVPEKKGIVRVQINTGFWILEPIDSGRRTRVTYDLLTNPGGNIPKWIVDASTTVGLPDLFNAVRKRATVRGD